MIRIIDCGSQLTKSIAKRVIELGACPQVVPVEYEHNGDRDLEGIIISGGQSDVNGPEAPLYDPRILDCGKPILGICYGHQSIAVLLGGMVQPSPSREYGYTKIHQITESRLLHRIPDPAEMWMSHVNIVTKMPAGFVPIAISENGYIASMEKHPIYSVQFHPESKRTLHGKQVLANFLRICDPKYDQILS